MLRSKRPTSRGQGMIEYLIIVALMAISAIAVMKVTSNSVKVAFGKIANALQARRGNLRASQVNQTDVESKNLNNFNDGSD